MPYGDGSGQREDFFGTRVSLTPSPNLSLAKVNWTSRLPVGNASALQLTRRGREKPSRHLKPPFQFASIICTGFEDLFRSVRRGFTKAVAATRRGKKCASKVKTSVR
jgi:hypothetical protein